MSNESNLGLSDYSRFELYIFFTNEAVLGLSFESNWTAVSTEQCLLGILFICNAFHGDFNVYFESEDEKRNVQFPSKITIRRSICFLTSGLSFKGRSIWMPNWFIQDKKPTVIMLWSDLLPFQESFELFWSVNKRPSITNQISNKICCVSKRLRGIGTNTNFGYIRAN